MKRVFLIVGGGFKLQSQVLFTVWCFFSILFSQSGVLLSSDSFKAMVGKSTHLVSNPTGPVMKISLAFHTTVQ